uniref:Uncharacterized protein n=1 Tax=Anguilla anguilla TaxID=7936 RepID=A0A0E9V9N4_ANGAN
MGNGEQGVNSTLLFYWPSPAVHPLGCPLSGVLSAHELMHLTH